MENTNDREREIFLKNECNEFYFNVYFVILSAFTFSICNL